MNLENSFEFKLRNEKLFTRVKSRAKKEQRKIF